MWKFILLISINYKQNFMKRFSLILAFCAYIFTSFAHDFEVDGIYYNLTSSNNNSTVSVTFRGNYSDSYLDEYSGAVSIPESVIYNGIPHSVTSIGGSAFVNCSGLTSVEIPNSVTSIGSYAFSGCSGLTSIVIPNSVTSIKERTFQNCSGLTSIDISNSVTSIGGWAFYGCSGLTSIGIPNSVTVMGILAFGYCSGLTSICFYGNCPSFSSNTFSQVSSSCKVYVPQGSKGYMANSLLKTFEIFEVEYAAPEMPSLSPAAVVINGTPIRWESSRDGGLTWTKIDCTSNVYVDENPERGKVLYRILNYYCPLKLIESEKRKG